jgi:hypothetical protein
MHPNSSDLHDEAFLYSWKPGSDRPIDDHNHAIDAIRYALSKPKQGNYAFTGKRSSGYNEDGEFIGWTKQRY